MNVPFKDVRGFEDSFAGYGEAKTPELDFFRKVVSNITYKPYHTFDFVVCDGDNRYVNLTMTVGTQNVHEPEQAVSTVRLGPWRSKR